MIDSSKTRDAGSRTGDPVALEWLHRLCKRGQGQVSFWAHRAAREGYRDPEEIVAYVRAKVLARCRRGTCHGEVHAAHERVLYALTHDREGALRYAEAAIEREQLEPELRKSLKASRAREHTDRHMAALAPTEKQLAFLRHLGCDREPSDRLEASRWIDESLSQRARPTHAAKTPDS